MREWRRKRNGDELRPRNGAREDLILDPAPAKSQKLVLNGHLKHHLTNAVLFKRQVDAQGANGLRRFHLVFVTEPGPPDTYMHKHGTGSRRPTLKG